jgi:shikimate dehydrogenase
MARKKPAQDRYALVGHPVGHSRSPLIHHLFAQQTGERISYELIDATPDAFGSTVRGFRDAGGKGMNVTVPHKEAAFRLADETGEAARAAKAVNTLSFANGAVRGDNTDGIGFMRDLTENLGQKIAGKRVAVLGAGGAARGILGPLLEAEPAALLLANRTIVRAQQLCADFSGHAVLDFCRFDDLGARGPFDIVINATSAGLHGEEPPFPESLIEPATFCYDLAYSVKSTPFVAWAKRSGSRRAVQGWGMLIEQAAESFRIWRGVLPDTAPIRRQLGH